MNHFRKRPFIAMGCYYFAAITLLAAVIVKAQPDVTLIGPPIGLPVGNVAPGYRGLPHLVMAGSSFEVTIAVTPDVTASVYAVEDHIPENATVTDISDNGSLDAINGLVKWGPFFDNQSRTLTYTVRIAEGETGKLSFSGSVSVDGVPSMIEGSDAVEIFSDFPVVNPPIDPPVAPPSGVVSPAFRTLPLIAQAGSRLEVSILAAPGVGTSVYAVEDRIPVGAAATEISDNGSFDAANGLVKWGPFFDSQSRSLSYVAQLAGGETGEVTFSGSVSVDGVASVIDGNNVVEIDDVRLPGSFGLEYPPSEQVFLKNAQPVKFSWNESSGATSYEVLVAKQGDAQVSVWATGVTTPEWSVDRDIGLGRWYWKVRARNGSGVAESGTFNFEVLEEMNQPEAFAAGSV